MPTININVVVGANTYGRSKTISGPNLTRFLAAYKTLLGQVPSGNVDANGAPTLRDMTDQETALAWADGIIAGTIANVKRVEQEAAASTAAAAVTDVSLT